MDHGDNVHLAGHDVIDDPVGAFQNFAYLWKLDLRDGTPGLGEGADLLGASGEPVNDSQSVFRRALSNVGVNASQMVYGSIGPMDPHADSPKEERTCSTAVVRPAWLSANPASTA